MSDTSLPHSDGTFAMPEVVWIPLANLAASAGYRTQLRDMDELEGSIRQFGVLSPLWVHPDPSLSNRYIIFAGHRRFEAAKKVARARCDSSLDTPISVQQSRPRLPCRVFRDMTEIHLALLAMTENVARLDPSTMDTAKELKRIKSLLEDETGRPAKAEDVLNILSGANTLRKPPGKRHLCRLLRISEIDSEVAAIAKEHNLASDFLDQVMRLKDKDEQLDFIRLIVDNHLTRKQVREIVNKKLAAGGSQLSAILAEVISPIRPSNDGEATASALQKPARTERQTEDLLDGAQGQVEDPAGDAKAGHLSSGISGLILSLRSQSDVDLLRAGDVLEAWSTSEGRREKTGQDTLKRWLTELYERRLESDDIEKLRVLLGEKDYSRLEIELARLLYMYQGILAEHLPGYVRHIGDAMGESNWYCSVVRCFLELLLLLRQPEESRKVAAPAKRLLNIVFHELFWLSIVYDNRLQYYVEKLPPLRKKEFSHFVLLNDHQGT